MLRGRQLMALRLRAGLLPALFFLIIAGQANAARISGSADNLSIGNDEPTPAKEILQEIADHLGLALRGTPGDDVIGRSLIEGASLHAALARLLPHAAFTISYRGKTTPVAVTFRGAGAPVHSTATAPTAAPALDTSNKAGVPVPAAHRAEFVKTLPMLRTR
mgnify:CR=1 FL=1